MIIKLKEKDIVVKDYSGLCFVYEGKEYRITEVKEGELSLVSLDRKFKIIPKTEYQINIQTN